MELSNPISKLVHFCRSVRLAARRAVQNLREEQRPRQPNSIVFQARDLKGLIRRAQRRLEKLASTLVAGLVPSHVRQAIRDLQIVLAEALATVQKDFETMAPNSNWVDRGQQFVNEMLVGVAQVESTLRSPS